MKIGKIVLLTFFMIFFNNKSFSQNFEVGPLLGLGNYIGDIGNESFLKPNSLVIGGLFKWNAFQRLGLRMSLLSAKIEGHDMNAKSQGRILRAGTFENDVFEFSIGPELNFENLDMYSFILKGTAYIYSGLSIINYTDKKITSRGREIFEDKRVNAIPIAVGYKYPVTRNLLWSGEIGFRYTFTDNLDYSDPDISTTIYSIGTKDRNDWLAMVITSFTYTFGKKFCFCPTN